MQELKPCDELVVIALREVSIDDTLSYSPAVAAGGRPVPKPGQNDTNFPAAPVVGINFPR